MSALVLVALAAVGEGAARLTDARFPEWTAGGGQGVLMAGHPTRLWGMAPGTHGNGSATATINTLGLRGALPELPRPAGRQRVLVLGDSSFFGHGIADDEALAPRLEAALRAAGVDADAVNGGVPGYSTEQTRLLLDEVGWSVEPTLLLIGNLWSDNNVDAFKDRDLLASARAGRSPLYRSALFRTVAVGVDRARGGEGAHVVTWTRDSTWPRSQDRRVPIADYAANLDAMARAAHDRGVGVVFLAPVNRGLLDGEFDVGGALWDVYFAAQAAVAAHHGVPVVSARAGMAAGGGDSRDLFVDVMHPSAAGAARIADEAARTLLAAGWPATPLLAGGGAFDTSALHDDARTWALPSTRQQSIQSTLFPAER